MRDAANSTKSVLLLEPTDLAYTDTNSAYIDLYGYEGCKINVIVSALTGVDGSNYLTPILYEVDATPGTASGYSAVAAADMIGGLFTKIDSTSEDSTIQERSYIGDARYLYVKLDYNGTGISAGVVGVVAELSRGRHQPIDDDTVTTGAVT